MIVERKGDILTTRAEALVNTVNCVGVMGKGLARQVREAFPEVDRAYREDCLRGCYQPGGVRAYKTMPGSFWIVNLATKNHWRHPSRIEWIRTGLKNLLDFIRQHQIKSVAIPPIGCGNGGLDWAEVKPLILETFRGEEEVRVEVWGPS